jgi:hypothetical protein
MDTEPLPYQTDEYVILIRPYRDFPAGSVGVVAAIEASTPPGYHIQFGPALRRGPIPQDRLAPLKPARRRRP